MVQTIYHDWYVGKAVFSPDGKYVITTPWDNIIRIFPFADPVSILDKWSAILGSNAELTKEEKERYHLN